MELNPIAQRDLRARWRNWRAFGLIFIYAALLAGIMGWQYAHLINASQSAVMSSRFYAITPTRSFIQASDAPTSRQHLADVSLILFRSLNTMQILGWMLIAPALTAASIAGERERGLLEALQLSYLSATRIVGGKLLCALGFLILMLLIPLPIMAVCFTLGGISPAEFLSAAALQIATATTCALIGLAVSAWSRRVNIALTKSFLYILIWGLGTSSLDSFLGGDFRVLRGLNPVTSAQHMAVNTNYIYVPSPTSARWLQLLYTALHASDAAPWKICVGFEIILSLFLLWLAIRGTRKSLDTPHWIARKHWIDRLKRYIPQPDATASATSDVAEKWKQRARHALWWEFPLVALLRFSNPILQREARNKLRLRGTGWKSGLLKLALGGVGAYYYINWFAMALDYAPSRARTGWQVIYCSLGATIIASAVLGASAIPREREAGTWEAIGLSLLPKRQILIGKVMPPLFACLLYSLPLWPLVIACADFHIVRDGPFNDSSGTYGAYGYNGAGYSSAYGYTSGIFFLYILAALIVIAATAWGCASLAMLISWRFQRASVAVCWTLGFFLLAFMVFPVLLSALHSTSGATPNVYSNTVYLYFAGSGRLEFNYQSLSLWRLAHPLLGLGSIERAASSGQWSYVGQGKHPLDACLNDALLPALGLAVVWFVGGLAALTLLHHLMRNSPRQADENKPTSWRYAKL